MMALLLLLFLATQAQAEDCSLLCANQTSICAIANTTAICDSSVLFNTSTSISIVNSTLYCVHVQTKAEPSCSITLLSSTIVIEKSKIVASRIEVNGPNVIISVNSTLNANGTGSIVGSGSPVHSNDAPSYGGRGGGTCGELSKFFTFGDQKDPREFYGSGGMFYLTRGGGIIIVDAENLYFYGVITASGNMPLGDKYLNTPSKPKEDANGGTGGSVYIKVTLYANSTGKIIAAGGNALNTGFGGGGGRIAIYGKFKPIVSAPGGVGTRTRCNEAGSGTIYFGDEDLLLIDNNGIMTRNPTPVTTWESLTLIVKNGATVTPMFSHSPLHVNKLELTNSRLEASQVAGSGLAFDSILIIIANEINLLGKSTLGRTDLELMNITCYNLTVDYSSGIFFGMTLRISAATQMEVKGEIEGNLVAPDSSWIFISSAMFMQRKESTMKAEMVVIKASMMLLEGMIQASIQTCTTEEENFNVNPPYHWVNGSTRGNLTKEDLPVLLEGKFTLIMEAVNITTQESNQIFGSRIGIFGVSIKLSGMVSASGYGCSSDNGIGKGSAKENTCAGSGAGYGGRGGNGRPIKDEFAKLCQGITNGGRSYSDDLNPWFEGSGGGSDPVVGGSGGGFIDIEAVGVLDITGMISADGEDAPREASNLRSGSGGGSGGGIYIKTRRLTGTGSKISAAGGRGTVKGGGGGGGRILFSWIGNTTGSVTVNELDQTFGWDGMVEVSGGMPGEECAGGLNESGSNGTLRAERCAPGTYGYLCAMCKPGFYKEGTEYSSSCAICMNSPKYGLYTNIAESSSNCSYKCPSGYTDVSENKLCDSPLKEFFSLFGGIGGTIGVTFAALSLIALIALLMIDYCSKWRRKYQQSDLQNRLISSKEVIGGDSKPPKKKANMPEITKEDLPFHEHRIYLIGDNTYYKPWSLPTTPPASIQSEVVSEDYAHFANEVNTKARWFRWQYFICWILFWVYHPLGLLALHMARKRKFQEIRDYVQGYGEDLWRKIDLRLLANSLRFSCSEDCTLAFLDVISCVKKIVEWDERPVLPLMLLTEGDGSFYKPYRLDPNDLLLQLIGASLESDALEEYQLFIHSFNLNLRTVRLACPLPNRNQKELLQLRTLVENYNEDLFHQANFHVVLALFQAPMMVVNGKYVENMLTGSLNAELIDEYSDQLQRGELLRLYSFRLGLIVMDFRGKKEKMERKAYARSLYYEPNVTSLASDSLEVDRGIRCVPDPIDSAPFSECSLRGLLLVPEMWNQHLVLFILSLLVLLDIVPVRQTIKLLLLLDFLGTRNIFGFIMFGCVMPGVNIITPILGIVMAT